MVSEAVRFRYIENELGVIIQDNVHSAPDPSVIQLEDSWKSLSREIQGSNQGMFRRPVRLQRRDGSWFQVFSVQSIATSISLMNVACKSSSSDSLFHSQLKLSPLIRLATSSSEEPSDDDVDYCPVDVEPTLQIVGPGGMCLAPRDGQYNNGNPIELTPCRSSPEQLWTFRRDGTIRSQAGNCMAAYGRSTGNDNYIMIYDCDPKVDVFRWRVWANGTIASDSGLVLSAASPSGSGAVSAQLTLEENTYSPAQSWLPTNNTAPYMARFVGIFRFCLQASLDDVLVAAACVPAAEDQAWFMYPDGSMRPQGKLTRCIAAVDAQLLKIVDCDAASSQQRWQLATDGTIVNPASQLVMDVKGYVRSGLRIFLNSPQGTTSQKWFQAIHP
ncbi:hypothetical protein BS78_06G247600 [Paspalum vaginatum]|nr:hypothetical protein BS78_06G247600 [Paspalum vaginatum]